MRAMDAKQAERVPLWRVIADVARASGLSVMIAVVLLAPSCCLIGLPAFGYFAGRSYLHAMGVRRAGVSTWALGLLGAPLFVAPLVSLALADAVLGAIGDASEGFDAGHALVAVSVSALVGVVAFPLYGAPLEAVSSASGALDAVLASGARAARMGFAKSIGTGASLGVVGIAPWLVVPLARRVFFGANALVWLVLALFVATVIAQTVCLGIVAHAHGEGRERFGHARTHAPRETDRVAPRPRLIRSFALAALPFALLVPALLTAIATPTPGWRTERDSGDLRGEIVDGTPLLGSEHGLVVSQDRSVWRVTTADGGGAGEVRIAFSSASLGRIVRERFRGREVWTLRVPVREHVVLVSFDDRGVRVDDTPSDRIHARLGTLGVGMLALLLVALGALLVLTLRHTGVAANLDRPWLGGYRETAALVGPDAREAYVRAVERENVLAALPLAAIAIGLAVTIVVNL